MFLGTNRFLRSQNINLQLWEETTSVVEEITRLCSLTRLACGEDDDNDDGSTHGQDDMGETEDRRGGRTDDDDDDD